MTVPVVECVRWLTVRRAGRGPSIKSKKTRAIVRVNDLLHWEVVLMSEIIHVQHQQDMLKASGAPFGVTV